MKPGNEDLIRRFLLGEMTEQERFEFEEQFVADDGLFEQIKAVEDDLIEKYVRGWMPSDERSMFESNFLTTKKRRGRVAFSNALIKRIEAASMSDAIVREDEKPSFFDGLRSWFFTPQIAAFGAIGLLIAIVGGWLLVQNLATGRQELVTRDNTNEIGSPETAATPGPVSSPADSPEPDNNPPNPADDKSIEGSNQKPAPTEKPKKTPIPSESPKVRPAARNPVLALFPGTVRSGGKTPVLDRSGKPKSATLRLNLKSIDYKTYTAEITNADGAVVIQFNGLKPTKNALNIVVSVNKLSRGDYLIKVSGKNDAGENESAADFQFRVK